MENYIILHMKIGLLSFSTFNQFQVARLLGSSPTEYVLVNFKVA